MLRVPGDAKKTDYDPGPSDGSRLRGAASLGLTQRNKRDTRISL